MAKRKEMKARKAYLEAEAAKKKAAKAPEEAEPQVKTADEAESILEKIDAAEQELHERVARLKTPDEPISEEVLPGILPADEAAPVEDASDEVKESESTDADAPKKDDSKEADKADGETGSVVAGAEKRSEKKPKTIDVSELDNLSAKELDAMARQMTEQVERARQKLAQGEQKAALVCKKAAEKAKQEEEARRAAEKAKKEAEAKAAAEKAAKEKAEAEAMAKIATVQDSDGPFTGAKKGYEFWSVDDQKWILTSDLFAAQQFGGDSCRTVWLWYNNGRIDHKATFKEAEPYLPK